MWKLICVYVHNIFYGSRSSRRDHDCVSENKFSLKIIFITTVFIFNIFDSVPHTKCESMKEFEIIKLKNSMGLRYINMKVIIHFNSLKYYFEEIQVEVCQFNKKKKKITKKFSN